MNSVIRPVTQDWPRRVKTLKLEGSREEYPDRVLNYRTLNTS